METHLNTRFVVIASHDDQQLYKSFLTIVSAQLLLLYKFCCWTVLLVRQNYTEY